MTRIVDALRPGLRVFVPTLSAESTLLRESLESQPERASGVHFVGIQFPGIDRTDYLALHPQARQTAYFMSPAVREGWHAGRAEPLALDYLGIARQLRDDPPFDLAVAQLSPPDTDGWCSAGLAADFVPLVWSCAHRRAAHLNPRMPRTPGSFRVHVRELDIAEHVDADLLDHTEPPCGEVESRIGAHVATLVRDGDTLQFGIGSVPVALTGALANHRRLRIHAGMVSAAVRTLWERGALDRDARITTGVVLGNASMREFAAELPNLWLTDVTRTHDPALISAIPRFVAVNTAVEVDLFGQVNAERAGGAIRAGAGGLPAFAQGALASPGGRLLICMTATARGGRVSRIVPALTASALCTLPRHLSDVVVTEHGIAELRSRSLDGRAQALIAIAAPEHRAALSAAWDSIRRVL